MYLFLASEEYGIEVKKVHEIIGVAPITRVPRAPNFIRGVINLRGQIIPIMDLRLAVGMLPAEQTEQTCIIVVQSSDTKMGVIVDRVCEVLNVDAGDIELPPDLGEAIDTGLLLGIAKTDNRVQILLDISKVLSLDSSPKFRPWRGVPCNDEIRDPQPFYPARLRGSCRPGIRRCTMTQFLSKLTIRRKLTILTALSVAIPLIIGANSFRGGLVNTQRSQAQATMLIALRNHLEADMMHDALPPMCWPRSWQAPKPAAG